MFRIVLRFDVLYASNDTNIEALFPEHSRHILKNQTYVFSQESSVRVYSTKYTTFIKSLCTYKRC
jgi:hypothetical protein